MIVDEGMFIQVISVEKGKDEVQKNRIINVFQSAFMKEPLVFVGKENLSKAKNADISKEDIRKQIEGALTDAATEYIDLVVKHVVNPTFTKYING